MPGARRSSVQARTVVKKFSRIYAGSGGMKNPLSEGQNKSAGSSLQDQKDSSYLGLLAEESEELFRVVFDSSCDAILLHTPAGEVFEANNTFLRMYGTRRSELPNVTIEKISSPSMSMAQARQIWARVLAGEPQTFEWKARRLDTGLEFDVEVFLRRMHVHGKEAILATVRDLTLRKQAEMALREQGHLAKLRADAIHTLQQPSAEQELLQTVSGLLVEGFDAVFARVWTLDASGQTLQLKASAGLYTHLDGSHSRVPLGQLKIGRIAQERRPHVTNNVLADPHIPAKDWARREGLVAFAGMPLISEGNLLGAVALFARHPLSPAAIETFEAIAGALAQAIGRKQAETALRAAREALAQTNIELERQVQERTAKLRETIEELRALFLHSHPMISARRCAPCKVSADCWSWSVTIALNRPAARYIRRIAAAAARMDRLVTDALQYGATVHQRFVLEPVDADAVLRGILESYPEFQSLDVKVEIPDRLPMVFANEAGMTQCFSNLLGNAVKFVQPGQSPRIRVRSERRGPFVRLWFEDEGIGIPARHHDKIWVMFQKLDKSTEGTGIGLALVRKVVERMGGTVGLESNPGQGARFWVELKSAEGHLKPEEDS